MVSREPTTFKWYNGEELIEIVVRVTDKPSIELIRLPATIPFTDAETNLLFSELKDLGKLRQFKQLKKALGLD